MPLDYEVGYKRPPKATQFQRGRSGNPKGRPKGSRNLGAAVDRELAQMVTITENGKRRRITKLEASVKQVVNRAASGDAKAMQLLLSIARSAPAPEAPPLAGEQDRELMIALKTRLKLALADAVEGDDDGPR